MSFAGCGSRERDVYLDAEEKRNKRLLRIVTLLTFESSKIHFMMTLVFVTFAKEM